MLSLSPLLSTPENTVLPTLGEPETISKIKNPEKNCPMIEDTMTKQFHLSPPMRSLSKKLSIFSKTPPVSLNPKTCPFISPDLFLVLSTPLKEVWKIGDMPLLGKTKLMMKKEIRSKCTKTKMAMSCIPSLINVSPRFMEERNSTLTVDKTKTTLEQV